MKRIIILFFAIILLSSCIVQFDLNSKQHISIDKPTQQELDEITNRLNPIFSMFHKNYDCEKDNIYDFLFHYDHLDYVYPNYNEEVKEHICEPLVITDYGIMLWEQYAIPQNDPLEKFPKILDEVYDENGNVSEEFAWELSKTRSYRDVIIGHNKFSGEYIDWLVEGVWNGTVDHDSFMEFEDETKLYYHDGFYYTPECVGDRGGGIMYTPVIDKITPLENNKYEIEYHLLDEADDLHSQSKAVVGIKESKDGFRFWSIFGIDFDIQE